MRFARVWQDLPKNFSDNEPELYEVLAKDPLDASGNPISVEVEVADQNGQFPKPTQGSFPPISTIPGQKPKKRKTKKFVKWVEYNYPPGFNWKDPIVQKSYEWFIGGYLTYYDNIVRSGAVNHSVYFKWDKTKVVVRIWPAPIIT